MVQPVGLRVPPSETPGFTYWLNFERLAATTLNRAITGT